MNTKVNDDGIPTHVGTMRTRVCEDGSFFVPRTDHKLIKALDERYTRVGNELRWCPKSRGEQCIKELTEVFKGKDCYIVGKGPSLDHLSATDFPNPDGIIIAVNESIHKVESLQLPNKTYMIQQDNWLKDTCRPKRADLLLAYPSRYWYADCPNKYVFHFADIGLKKNSLTVIYAIAIAKLSGAIHLEMMCFDACTAQNLDYAKCVGYEPSKGGKPSRFLTHKTSIMGAIHNTHHKFVTPKAHALSSSCKL